jgi:hypothetical protein
MPEKKYTPEQIFTPKQKEIGRWAELSGISNADEARVWAEMALRRMPERARGKMKAMNIKALADSQRGLAAEALALVQASRADAPSLKELEEAAREDAGHKAEVERQQEFDLLQLLELERQVQLKAEAAHRNAAQEGVDERYRIELQKRARQSASNQSPSREELRAELDRTAAHNTEQVRVRAERAAYQALTARDRVAWAGWGPRPEAARTSGRVAQGDHAAWDAIHALDPKPVAADEEAGLLEWLARKFRGGRKTRRRKARKSKKRKNKNKKLRKRTKRNRMY